MYTDGISTKQHLSFNRLSHLAEWFVDAFEDQSPFSSDSFNCVHEYLPFRDFLRVYSYGNSSLSCMDYPRKII